MCVTKYCRRPAREGRRKCDHCLYKEKKLRDPVKVSYFTLRNNANRRRKEFTISLEYFRQFCYETNYMNKKGIKKRSYHVDRIDESLGYIPGNIQVLENYKNVKKYISYSTGQYGKPDHFRYAIDNSLHVNKEDLPF